MTVIINGTTGVTSVNGTAAAPSVTGTDTDTGIVYGTNTLSLATGGTTAMTIDSSQNVIVPVGRITKTGTATSITLNTGEAYSASNALAIISGDSGADAINFRLYNVSYYYPFQFNKYGVMSVGGATAATSGAGITFPATQSASTDVNTLDDYEEGNWTPEIVGDSTNGTFTASYATGRYTKVGRVVTVFCIVGGTLSGAVGSAIVRGLPFAAGIGSQTISINEQRYIDITGYTQMGFELTNGTTYGYLYMSGISKSESPINVTKLASGGTSIVWISGSYIV